MRVIIALLALLALPAQAQFVLESAPYGEAQNLRLPMIGLDSLPLTGQDSATVDIGCSGGMLGTADGSLTEDGGGFYVLPILAGEAECEAIRVDVDASVPHTYVISTYGRPSAQHASLGGINSPVMASGTCESDSVTQCVDSGLIGGGDGRWARMDICFLSGGPEGQCRTTVQFFSSNGALTLDRVTAASMLNAQYVIVARGTSTNVQWWGGTAPLALVSQRVQTHVSTMAADSLSAAAVSAAAAEKIAGEVDASVDVAAIEAVTDKLDTMLEDEGGWRFTDDALAEAPAGGSGASAEDVWTYGTRVLTAGANLNDLSEADVRSAVGLSSANLDTQLSGLGSAISGLNDFDPTSDAVTVEAIENNVITADALASSAVEAIRVAFFATVIESDPSITLVDAFCLWNAVLLGESEWTGATASAWHSPGGNRADLAEFAMDGPDRTSATLTLPCAP